MKDKENGYLSKLRAQFYATCAIRLSSYHQQHPFMDVRTASTIFAIVASTQTLWKILLSKLQFVNLFYNRRN